MQKKNGSLSVIIPLVVLGTITAYIVKEKRKEKGRISPLLEEDYPFKKVMDKYLGEEAGATPIPPALLNKRQEKILSLIENAQGITTPEINKKIRNINERTLRRDLNLLIDLGLIKKEGSTKSSKYYTV